MITDVPSGANGCDALHPPTVLLATSRLPPASP